MKTDDELLGALYDATVNALLTRIKTGEATAADLSVARAMLRDQNISPAKGTNKATNELAKVTLPFPVSADDDHEYH